jgi:hypothetical protein
MPKQGQSPGQLDTTTDPFERAVAQVRAYCGWHIAPLLDDEDTLDGPGASVLFLPSLLVRSIVSITEDGTELDPADYSWSANGFVRRGSNPYAWSGTPGCWSGNLRSIDVSYTHGYDSWPEEVQVIIAELMDRMTTDAVAPGVVSKTIGPFTETYSTGDVDYLGASERSVLDVYRLPKRP